MRPFCVYRVRFSFVYFLPLFLIPCPPVFRGPFPPALAASSLRAFSSVDETIVSRCFGIK